MLKPILLLVIVAGVAAFGGYKFGTTSPTVGDCVNSFFGGK